jgi:pyruvate ferredoxin oxidoreductase alpha subunit
MLTEATNGRLERLTFLDLDIGIIERERSRIAESRRSGPTAENILRDLGTVASRIG